MRCGFAPCLSRAVPSLPLGQVRQSCNGLLHDCPGVSASFAPMINPEAVASFERPDVMIDKLERDILVLCWMQGVTFGIVISTLIIAISVWLHVMYLR